MKQSYKAAISLIIIITALSVGYISWKQKKETLNDDPVETKGVLKEVRGTKRYAHYEFSDALYLYNGRQKVSPSFLTNHKINDTVTVIYSRSNPEINKLKY